MSGVALVAMVLLLVLNGFFVAAEFAFTAAAKHRLEARPGRAARAAVRAIDDLSFSLAGAQLGITITSLLLGAVAEPAVASLIEASVGAVVSLSDDALHTISLVVALAIVVFLHMVIGEMGPKNVAISDPERSSLLMAIPFRLYSVVFRPVIFVLNGFANTLLRLVGIDPTDTKEAHTADDLASLITAGRREGVVEDFAHRLLTGAIELWDLRTESVMTPRPDMVAAPSSASPEEVERLVVDHGYSRIPIYGESPDDVAGFVHAKDLLRLDDGAMAGPLPPDIIRPLLVVPDTAPVSDVLEQMRQGRNHLALVVDEHGGTAGIVSMEDIVEEVVGEIRDEHDPRAAGMRRVAPDRWALHGSLRSDDVARAVGASFPDGDFDTIGGLVMAELGRIPQPGDRVSDEGWAIEVRSMEGRRVGEVELTRPRARRPRRRPPAG